MRDRDIEETTLPVPHGPGSSRNPKVIENDLSELLNEPTFGLILPIREAGVISPSLQKRLYEVTLIEVREDVLRTRIRSCFLETDAIGF